MRIAAFVLVIPLMASASAPAFAEPRPAEPARMVTDDCAIARRAGKACVLDIPAEDVDGTVPAVDDIAVRILSFGKAGSLIRIRRDFIPEVIKAAEDL
jgi:hypothetical protein